MQRTLALAVLAYGLRLAPCHGLWADGHCDDASVLLQGAAMQTPLNLATDLGDQVAGMKRTLGHLLRLAVAHSKEASRALTVLAQDSLAEDELQGVGCNATDREQLQHLVQKIPEVVHGVEGDVNAALEKSKGGPLVMPAPSSMVLPPLPSIKVPKPCERALNSKGDVIGCLHAMMGISRPCIRCVPQLLSRVGRDCLNTCTATMDRMAGDMVGLAQPLMGEVLAHAASFNTDRVMTKTTAVLNQALKQMLPCVTCMKAKFGLFGGCVGGGLKSQITQAMDGLLEDLRHGIDANTTVSMGPSTEGGEGIGLGGDADLLVGTGGLAAALTATVAPGAGL